jgi:hypothetical protein
MTFMQKLQNFDWLGITLTIGLYVSFAVAFAFGGTIWPWKSGRIIALIVVSGLLIIAFGITQYYSIFTSKNNRLFPCEFLRNPQLLLIYLCMACGGCALFVSIYYLPLFFLFVYGDNGVQAAVRLLPLVCFYVATILLCGAAMGRTGYHMVWYLLSGMFMIFGGALMYTVSADTPVANIYGYSVLLGLGMATTQAGYAVGPLLVKPDRVAEVIQFMNIAQGQSQLIGLAVASTIFQNTAYSGLKTVLAGTGYTDIEIQGAIAGARSAVLQTTTAEVRAQCIDVIVQSIQKVWIMVIAAAALYIVCSCFLTHRRF